MIHDVAGHLWALAVLHRRGHPIRTAWEALGPPQVDLPTVPTDVRQAIVREYAPGQRDTDPRWLLEAACLEPATAPDEEELLHRAAGALTAADLHPQAPISAHDEYQQGDSSYYAIRTSAGTVEVSTLGPFFQVADDDARAITALRTAGFRHIDRELGGTEISGLHVYYFGERKPLWVADLLFFWQD
jgi:hypothetical protein